MTHHGLCVFAMSSGRSVVALERPERAMAELWMAKGSSRGAWFVLQTKPRKESFVVLQLGGKGIETYLPRIVYRIGGGAIPLFPRYLFARFCLDQCYYAVKWTPGVTRLVSFGGEATQVHEEVVAFLRARGNGDGLIMAPSPFSSGQVVRISKGPFQGLNAIIDQAVSGPGRVKVLMDIVQQRTRVELPYDYVARA